MCDKPSEEGRGSGQRSPLRSISQGGGTIYPQPLCSASFLPRFLISSSREKWSGVVGFSYAV